MFCAAEIIVHSPVTGSGYPSAMTASVLNSAAQSLFAVEAVPHAAGVLGKVDVVDWSVVPHDARERPVRMQCQPQTDVPELEFGPEHEAAAPTGTEFASPAQIEHRNGLRHQCAVNDARRGVGAPAGIG